MNYVIQVRSEFRIYSQFKKHSSAESHPSRICLSDTRNDAMISYSATLADITREKYYPATYILAADSSRMYPDCRLKGCE